MEQQFLMYKGYPLVRSGDVIYYGYMSDTYVVMINILSSTEENGIQKATKLKLFLMATDETLSPMERIKKNSERSSLYEALEFGYAWLQASQAKPS